MDEVSDGRDGTVAASRGLLATAIRESVRRISIWLTGSLPIAKAIGIFLLGFIVVRHVDPKGILFYQGVVVGGLVAVVETSMACWVRPSQRPVLIRNGLIVFLLVYAFTITVPTNADRSFSLLMLQWIGQQSGGLSKDEIDLFFAADFLNRGGLDQRLIEQTTTGTLVERDGKYSLTAKGEAVNAVARATCILFICKGREHSPTISPISLPDATERTR